MLERKLFTLGLYQVLVSNVGDKQSLATVQWQLDLEKIPFVLLADGQQHVHAQPMNRVYCIDDGLASSPIPVCLFVSVSQNHFGGFDIVETKLFLRSLVNCS